MNTQTGPIGTDKSLLAAKRTQTKDVPEHGCSLLAIIGWDILFCLVTS